MTTQAQTLPRLQSATIARCERGFEVRWQRDGRPTRRQFHEYASATAFAYQLASLRDLPVIDLTGGPE